MELRVSESCLSFAIEIKRTDFCNFASCMGRLDCCRYLCLSLPLIRQSKKKSFKSYGEVQTFSALIIPLSPEQLGPDLN